MMDTLDRYGRHENFMGGRSGVREIWFGGTSKGEQLTSGENQFWEIWAWARKGDFHLLQIGEMFRFENEHEDMEKKISFDDR